MSDLMRLLGQRRVSEEQFPGTYEGVVKSASSAGVVFTIPEYSTKYEFGPAPFPQWATTVASLHSHVIALPAAGDRVLVVFAGGDVSRPWVLGWWT